MVPHSNFRIVIWRKNCSMYEKWVIYCLLRKQQTHNRVYKDPPLAPTRNQIISAHTAPTPTPKPPKISSTLTSTQTVRVGSKFSRHKTNKTYSKNP